MSTYSKKELEKILNEGDAKMLSKVSGLGMKGAQKIILDLRGKIDLNQDKESGNNSLKELKSVLKTLGFSGDSLKEYVEYGEGLLSTNSDIDIEDLVKKVLSQND
jgi:Holliday junction DNA helicase RuvA